MPKEKKSWLQEWVETKEGKAWHQNYIDFWKMIPEKDRASYDLSGAASNGDLKEVSGLIKKGADVNITHGFSRTPLHEAAWGEKWFSKSTHLLRRLSTRRIRLVIVRYSLGYF